MSDTQIDIVDDLNRLKNHWALAPRHWEVIDRAIAEIVRLRSGAVGSLGNQTVDMLAPLRRHREISS